MRLLGLILNLSDKYLLQKSKQKLKAMRRIAKAMRTGNLRGNATLATLASAAKVPLLREISTSNSPIF